LTALFGALWGTERFHWSTALFGSVVLFGVALSTGTLRWHAGQVARPAED
jgi:hypothetical protein